MKKTMIKVSAVALAMLFAAGCASTGTVDDLNSRIEAMEASVANAASAADAASASASEARQMASGAQSTANQALNAANQGQACCDATNEKIDRMFQKGMSK
ncbi:MAG: Lpp/OprI family alanine-zipper lipoprotein [Gammaproteobacteria bacterium]|nr:Lpp/OprI family alanine-zipper lipoprotein [Gammaproteobacteria bacterium]